MLEHSHVSNPNGDAKKVAAEFFAGIGLVRLGLELGGFTVGWSNDYELSKTSMYEGHFGAGTGHELVVGDVAKVTSEQLPQDLALAWASFPCTDLSLAGNRAGLKGIQSGTFWHFSRLLRELGAKRPSVVALENVHGLATSHGGDDLTALIRELNDLGYSVDLVALDAKRFVPQSRPRIFIVGSLLVPAELETNATSIRPDFLQGFFSDPTLKMHQAKLPEAPQMLTGGLGVMIEELPKNDPRWWDENRSAAVFDSLSDIQRGRLEAFKESSGTLYRTAYRRTRNGVAVWEIRPDDISGCLRTARGGSSKQAVVRVSKGKASVRWMTAREYARLMGAGDYVLDGLRESQALFGFGDAVCVPAVGWLAKNYLSPLCAGKLGTSQIQVAANVA